MKFNYKAPRENMLLGYARMGLNEKLDELPDISENNTDDEKYSRYELYLLKEISTLEEIGFAGYMLLLQDVITVSKEISDTVECFGSIQNSLTAFALGIIDKYKFDDLRNFMNFTPFTKNTRVNILISSHANNGCVGYVKHKYPDIIKKAKKRSILFNDDFKIKFINLDLDVEIEKEDLDQKSLEVLTNNKII